jgi:hypothetical protein
MDESERQGAHFKADTTSQLAKSHIAGPMAQNPLFERDKENTRHRKKAGATGWRSCKPKKPLPQITDQRGLTWQASSYRSACSRDDLVAESQV